MAEEFVSIPVTKELEELVNSHNKRITEFYSLSGRITIVEAFMKVIQGSGTYYKFRLRDSNDKNAVVKIDKVHSESDWSTESWK